MYLLDACSGTRGTRLRIDLIDQSAQVLIVSDVCVQGANEGSYPSPRSSDQRGGTSCSVSEHAYGAQAYGLWGLS
jgi:hypothetical protein